MIDHIANSEISSRSGRSTKKPKMGTRSAAKAKKKMNEVDKATLDTALAYIRDHYGDFADKAYIRSNKELRKHIVLLKEANRKFRKVVSKAKANLTSLEDKLDDAYAGESLEHRAPGLTTFTDQKSGFSMPPL